MKSAFRLLVAGLALSAGLASAARVVARVTDTSSVQIRGVTVPMQEVSSWPVALDDEVATGPVPATLRFADGSTVSLARNTKVRVEADGSSYSVRVVSGSVRYNLNPKSAIRVIDAKITDGAPLAALSGSRQSSRGALVSSAGPLTGSVDPMSAAVAAMQVIVLPNGTRLYAVLGEDNVLRIQKIEYAVTLPDGKTAYVPSTGGALIGAAVTIDTEKPGEQEIRITPQGSATPLSPENCQQELDKGATTAVQGAIEAGEIPAGAAPVPAPPVSTGTLSAPAP